MSPSPGAATSALSYVLADNEGEGGLLRPIANSRETALIRQAAQSNSIPALESALYDHFGPANVVLDRGAYIVHRPSQDGASGELGHLGACLGRVFVPRFRREGEKIPATAAPASARSTVAERASGLSRGVAEATGADLPDSPSTRKFWGGPEDGPIDGTRFGIIQEGPVS